MVPWTMSCLLGPGGYVSGSTDQILADLDIPCNCIKCFPAVELRASWAHFCSEIIFNNVDKNMKLIA